MQLNIKKFALAAAAAMGVVYLICAIFVLVFPDFSAKLFGWMFHLINVEQFAEVGITFGGFIIGFLQSVIYTYLSIYLFAWLYNRFIKN